mgnify:CR=1 FL=1
MRIRQLVLVSDERDSVVEELCSLFEIEVAFYDPGIIHFGLENAVIPVGDTSVSYTHLTLPTNREV